MRFLFDPKVSVKNDPINIALTLLGAGGGIHPPKQIKEDIKTSIKYVLVIPNTFIAFFCNTNVAFSLKFTIWLTYM